MQWFSMDEHQPILALSCVLLAIYIPATGEIYLTLGQWDNGWKDWEEEFDLEKDLGHKVLYFCYPDPIPKIHQ